MNKGFTLIEIIIAISIMLIGVVGIYALVPSVLSITTSNTNKFIASQLAREAMEVVRNIRDTNWLKDIAWNNGLDQGSNYGIQYNGDSLIENYGDNFLQRNSDGFYGYNGKFGYSGGTDTIFKREIAITNIASPTLNVRVKIIWLKQGLSTTTFAVEENLYDWK